MNTVTGAGSGTPTGIEPDPPVSVKREWCKACGICIEFCPKNVFESDDEGRPVVSHPEACSLCHICQHLCPDFALRVRREDRAQRN
jgi:2-oxoglutarate ferredoxin oxidoreductase subunit delta